MMGWGGPGGPAKPSESYRVMPGDRESTAIVHVPHSSRLIPGDVRTGIMLGDDALDRELDAMTDSYTDIIAKVAADLAGVRPWLFINQLSRLVVDPERFPDEREELNAVGMGAVYTSTAAKTPLRDASGDYSDLIERYFHPYAAAIQALVDTRLAAAGRVTIVDLHSYPLTANPYELHTGPRPEICLGTDAFHTSPALLANARSGFSEFEIDTDTPFAGCYVPLAHYQTSTDVEAIMLELRRDLYIDADFELVDSGSDRLAASVASLINAIDGVAS